MTALTMISHAGHPIAPVTNVAVHGGHIPAAQAGGVLDAAAPDACARW
ncbi:MAG: hypothetical protein U0575_08790 [Phycisphaerales bacterium]